MLLEPIALEGNPRLLGDVLDRQPNALLSNGEPLDRQRSQRIFRVARTLDPEVAAQALAGHPRQEGFDFSACGVRYDAAERLAEKRRQRLARDALGGGVEREQAGDVGLGPRRRAPHAEADLYVVHDVGIEPDLSIALAVFGDIAAGAHERGDPPALAPDRLPDRIELADASVRAHDPFEPLKAAAPLDRLTDPAPNVGAIIRVKARKEEIERDGARSRLEPVDAVELVGPLDGAGFDVPFPAADLGDPLGGGELTLDAGDRVCLQTTPSWAVPSTVDRVTHLGHDELTHRPDRAPVCREPIRASAALPAPQGEEAT